VTRTRFGASLALPFVCLAAVLAAPAAIARAIADVPNDPYFDDQWGLQDINAPAAWDLSTGAGVKVAVVDTGVRATQPDLVGHVLPGWGFDGTTDDSNDHGTRVSSVIAAIRNNGKGIAGVAPDASIVPIRAFDGASTFDEDTIVQALAQAADSGARVVNASFGTVPPLSGREAARIRAKIDGALAAHPNTLYVAAAGNDGNDNDVDPVYPCSSDQPNLICVGAYKESGALTSNTNYGAQTVDVYAPGESIYTASKFNIYFPDSGTSLAAPFVSGEAALLFSKVPRLSPEEAISLILGSAAPLQAGVAKAGTAGRPDALAALQAAVVDSDRDGVYDVVDACPSQAYSTVDGCDAPPVETPTPIPTVSPAGTPTPTPTPHHEPVPRLRSVKTTVTRCKPHRSCKRSATVKLTPDRSARVSLKVYRQVCVKRRCRWSRVLSTSVNAGTRGARVVVRGPHKRSLKTGLYRLVAVPSSAAGTGRSAEKKFRVR